jgi:hypothetical protein
MQNLRQKRMTVKEYTEEFYQLNIRTGRHESDDEKFIRYMNGLRYEIQYEMRMVTIRNVEDDYQNALRAEENLVRKQGQRGRGRSQSRGKSSCPRQEYTSPRMKRRNLIITQKEEEVHRGDNMPIEKLFLEPEEEEEAEEVR